MTRGVGWSAPWVLAFVLSALIGAGAPADFAASTPLAFAQLIEPGA